MRIRHGWLGVATVLLLLVCVTSLEAKKPTFQSDTGDAYEMTGYQMRGVTGKKVSIEKAAGKKGTLVLFTCNACPWVKAWEDRIVELGNHYSRKGIGVIAINANDPNRVAEDSFDNMITRAKDKGMKFPYVVDDTSNVARAFGAGRTPEAFLFDADGKLVYHGTIDDNAKSPEDVKETWLKDAMQALVDGSPVPVASTKALGCSIKFRPES
jgi:thiol-disulfide isomerase/thioredoxin